MSYISVMAVGEGIIMTADRQVTTPKDNRIMTKTASKIFTIGDNIGVVIGGEMYAIAEKKLISLLFGEFCKHNTFENPKNAADKIFDFLCSIETSGDYLGIIALVAGYDRKNNSTEIYYIATQAKELSYCGDLGFINITKNYHFKPCMDKINEKLSGCGYMHYTLQDSIDISKFGIDMTRFIDRYIEFRDYISDDIEMLSITPQGIQWIIKKELEAKPW